MKVVQILTPEFSNISNENNIELGPGEKMTIIVKKGRNTEEILQNQIDFVPTMGYYID